MSCGYNAQGGFSCRNVGVSGAAATGGANGLQSGPRPPTTETFASPPVMLPKGGMYSPDSGYTQYVLDPTANSHFTCPDNTYVVSLGYIPTQPGVLWATCGPMAQTASLSVKHMGGGNSMGQPKTVAGYGAIGI